MSVRPNILLITSDQQHYDTIGVTNPKIKTPALDRLCLEGTSFSRSYCPNPVCTPSRASIITGQYPSQHGAWTIGVKLPEDLPTVGGQLSAAGYDTCLIGKAHLQPLASCPGAESLECHPTLRNLDFWRGFNGPHYGFDHIELARNHGDQALVGQHYAVWMEERGLTNWKEYFQPLPGDSSSFAPEVNNEVGYWARKERHWKLPEDFHYSRWTADRSIAFLQDRRREAPFFLWASFHDPHPPYTVPEPWASMYDPEELEPGNLFPGEHDRNPPHFLKTQEANPDFGDWHKPYKAHGCESHLYPRKELRKDMAAYYGMISLMDRHIERIVDELDRQGLAEDTLVVFSSDHGHFIGQHGLIAKGPFHYEDLIKVPFIVRWPGKVPAGETSDAMQSLIDLAPTFLAAADEGVPGLMQGVSQLDVWQGRRRSVRESIICENRHNPVMPHLRTYVEQRYKITVYREEDYGELFDLEKDPFEVNNLWDDPSATELKQRLSQRFLQLIMREEPKRMQRIADA
jgi:arylsulfatase A-like enzyme